MGDLSRATVRLSEIPEVPRSIRDVLAERRRQDEKWGQQNHTPVEWIAILTEEVGEAAAEALSIRFGGQMQTRSDDDYRTEMVQTAAVAIAAIESFDRLRALAATPSNKESEAQGADD